MLNTYLTKTQRLLFDSSNQFWTQTDVTAFINEARGQIASEAQCVRVIPPSGANQNQTVNAQEVYTFATCNAFVQLTSGVDKILFVDNVAVSLGASGSLKPMLLQKDWAWLQAFVRSYPLSGQPAMWAQFGQGENGSIYIQPVPTQALPMDWDCICTPIDLVDDTTAEAIPYPWTDCVPYFAAYLGFMCARRPEEAKNMFSIYTDFMKRARTMSEPSFVPDYYA